MSSDDYQEVEVPSMVFNLSMQVSQRIRGTQADVPSVDGPLVRPNSGVWENTVMMSGGARVTRCCPTFTRFECRACWWHFCVKAFHQSGQSTSASSRRRFLSRKSRSNQFYAVISGMICSGRFNHIVAPSVRLDRPLGVCGSALTTGVGRAGLDLVCGVASCTMSQAEG